MSLSAHHKQYWLYVLQLKQNKYYIGITSRKDPSSRIREHMNGYYSAQWVKKYKPLSCLEKINLGSITETQAYRLENKRTLQYMKKYGVKNVRGGKYSYSGDYIYLRMLGLFYRKEDFELLVGISFMVLVIVTLGIMAIK